MNRTCCESLQDFENLFDYFCSAPIAPDLPLSSLPAESDDGSAAFVFILSYLSDKTVDEICGIAAKAGRTEVILCEPFEKMQRGKEFKRIYEGYIDTMTDNGIDVRSVASSETD